MHTTPILYLLEMLPRSADGGKMRSEKGDLPDFIKVKYVGGIATIEALTFPSRTHLAWFHFYILNSTDWMNAWLRYQAACAKYLTSANLWQALFINLCFIILTSMHTLPFCFYLQVNWFLRKWRGQQKMLEHTFFCWNQSVDLGSNVNG